MKQNMKPRMVPIPIVDWDAAKPRESFQAFANYVHMQAVETGVLRRTQKINWRKDRGKDVPSAPWYKVFKGDRINDHHLTLAEKREAREL